MAGRLVNNWVLTSPTRWLTRVPWSRTWRSCLSHRRMKKTNTAGEQRSISAVLYRKTTLRLYYTHCTTRARMHVTVRSARSVSLPPISTVRLCYLHQSPQKCDVTSPSVWRHIAINALRTKKTSSRCCARHSGALRIARTDAVVFSVSPRNKHVQVGLSRNLHTVTYKLFYLEHFQNASMLCLNVNRPIQENVGLNFHRTLTNDITPGYKVTNAGLWHFVAVFCHIAASDHTALWSYQPKSLSTLLLNGCVRGNILARYFELAIRQTADEVFYNWLCELRENISPISGTSARNHRMHRVYYKRHSTASMRSFAQKEDA